MTESLTQKTVHGLKWSYVSTITTALMQIGYTAVMARLLNPSDFGLVAMGNVVLSFGSYFAQMGMGSAIIQKEEITKEQIKAAFTSSVFLGFIFLILTFLLAPLTRYIFDNQSVIPLVRVMGLSFLLNGFSLTALALIRRELKFKALAIAEVISFSIGYIIVGIGSALIGFGVWSLVFASLVQSALIAIMVFIIIKHELSLSFSWDNYKPLISFGSKISIISFLEFIGSTLDTILIGRFFGSISLGIYNRAQRLINLPMQYFTSSFSRVLFPSFSQIQKDNDKIKRNIFLILQIVAIIIFPFAIFISVLSKEIVEILLGPKWLEASLLLKILAFAAAINLFTHFIAVLFEAKGLLKQKIIIQCSFIVILSISFYYALGFGVLGFPIALLICQILKLFHYLFYFLREFKIGSFETLRQFISPCFTSIVIFILVFPFYQYIINCGLQNYIILISTLLLFLIVYIFVLYSKINNHVKNEFINKLKLLKT